MNAAALTQHPRHWANVAPARAAVVFGGSGEIITYAQLSERSDRCAQLLRKLGLTRLQPRPYHPKKDAAAQEAFKKTSPAW